MTAAPPRPRPSLTAPRTSRGDRRTLWPAWGFLALAVLVLAIAGVVASATGETTTQEDNFAAAHLDALEVELQAGRVRVVVEAREAVAVTTRLTSGRWADATADVALADGTLSVVGGCTRALFFSRCRTEHEIALPLATAARIQVTAAAGHVEIAGFAGTVDATSAAGSIDLSRFSGSSARLETAAGAITVDARAAPSDLEATTAAGRITVTVPDEVYRVSAETVAGRVAVRVREDPAADRALTLRSTAGSITVDPRTLRAAPQAEEPGPEAPGGLEAPGDLEAFVDDLMADHLDRFAVAGASVTVVDDGAVVLSKGYGHADADADVPVAAGTTLFPTASVAKLFTWTAVMQLVEDGALDLDAEVNSYLDTVQIPATHAEPVRVRHLLSHTAGFEDKPVLGAFSRTADDLPDLETALLRSMPARAWALGGHTAYSNYSTALAAHLVAEVAGTSWDEYLETAILEPLGMTRTTARQPVPDHLAADVTTVFTTGAEGEPDESFPEFSLLPPAGGMVATTDDMGRFLLAHLRHGRLGEARIMDERTVRRMHSQLFTHDVRLAGNAHGFWETEEHGERILVHPGDLNTAHTVLALAPDRGLGLYVAYNSVGGVEAREAFWTAFWDYALPEPAPAPTVAPQPAGTHPPIDRFAGRYVPNRVSTTTLTKLHTLFGIMTVSVDDGLLVTELSGLDQQRWVQAAADEFTEIGGPGRMIFQDDADGRVSHVVFGGSPMAALSPLLAFVPVSWDDTPWLHGGLLAFSLLLLLSGVVLWPVLAVVRRRRGPAAAVGARVARWWGAGTGGLFLLFAVLLAITLLDFRELEYGLPALLTVALGIGVTAAVLTVGTVVHAIQAWRTDYWGVAGRVHYTLVAVACVTLVWQLHHWNLLGFHV